MSKNYPDREVRERIENNTDKTMMIEAAAGTGKTYSMALRVMSLIRKGVSIDRIVTITFTKKAAGELADRLREMLNDNYLKAGDPEIKKRFKHALFDFSSGNISTIHSFCEQILKEFPVEANIDPEFDIKDEAESENMVRELWKEFVNIKLPESDQFISRALFFGLKYSDLEDNLLKRVLYRELDVPKCEKQKKTPPPDATLHDMEEYIALVKTNIGKCINNEDEGRKMCLYLLDAYDRFSAGCGTLKGESLLKYRIKSCLDFKGMLKSKGSQKNWNPKEALKEIKAGLKHVKEKIGGFRERLQIFFYSHLSSFIEEFLLFYKERKRQYSIVDFSDILIDTRNLLRDKPYIRQRLASRFEKILVDEFQDTDPLQVEILFFLSEKEGREPAEDWREVELEPGKLFFVGDPKQSIFRFRRADISIYEKTKEHIKGGEGLSANFRSQPVLLDFVNDVFEKRIGYKPYIQPEYRKLEPSGDVTLVDETHLISVRLDYANDKSSADQVRTEEAYALARLVKKLIADGYMIRDTEYKKGSGKEELIPLAPEHILMLFKARTAYGIFRSVFETEGFYVEPDKEQVYTGVILPQVTEFLRVLSRPDDEVALVSLLRGIFFGVDDNTLFEACAAGRRFNLGDLTKNIDTLPEKLKGAVVILAGLREKKHKMTPVRFISEALDCIGAHVITALGNSRSPDRRRFERLKEKLVDKIDTHLSLESAMEEAVSELDNFIVENPVITEKGKIRMMTVFKAKGLESPVIILCDCMSFRVSGIDSIPLRDENQILLNYRCETGFGKLDFKPFEWTDEKESEEKEYYKAEYERLRYVGVTRARDLLIVPYYSKGENYFTAPIAEKIIEYSEDENKKGLVEVYNASNLLGGKYGKKVDESRILDFHDNPFMPKAENVPEVTDRGIAGQWEKVRKEKEAKLKELADNASVIVPVTERAEEIRGEKGLKRLGEIIFRKKHGAFGVEGVEAGTFFHNLYELLLKHPDIDADKLIEYCISGMDFSDLTGLSLEDASGKVSEKVPGKASEMKAAAWGLVKKWKNSGFFRRVSSADKLFIETPFLYRDAGSRVVYNGKIDLLFEEAGKWFMVDLKSDPMDEKRKDEKKVVEALEPYRYQLGIYKKAVEAVMGVSIAGILLYFMLDDVELWG